MLERLVTPEKEGAKEAARRFFARLSEGDNRNVLAVVEKVDEIPSIHRVPFAAVYGIGGYVTKEGERPDIDLLVAMDLRMDYDASCDEFEPLIERLHQLERLGMRVQTVGKLPHDYNVGATKGKMMVRLTPATGKPIDVVYVKSVYRLDGPKLAPKEERIEFLFSSETEFLRRDCDEAGNSLPKVLLYSTAPSRPQSPPSRPSSFSVGFI